jgi:acyl-CoA thioester hydrolase
MNEIDLRSLKVTDYPISTYDKIRYKDTDRQGHVNNALFATYFETGRVELLYKNESVLEGISDASFVIAAFDVSLVHEIFWPGIVEIATGILKIGNSSITLIQGLYQNDQLAATNQSVIVFVDKETKKSKSLPESIKDKLQKYIFHQK